MRALCTALLLILPAAAQQFTIGQLEHQPLTNENVVTLSKAGFDELFIIQLIRNSRTSFDTSVEGLVALKQAGVSEDLIRFMAMPQERPPAPPSQPAASPAKVVPQKSKGKKTTTATHT